MANTTDWLNISAQSGSSGTTRLTLTARRNTSLDYKQATITAYNPVYNITARTYVTLESYTPYLAVSPTQLGVPASGGTYELSISGNCEWVIAFPDMVSSYSTSAGTGDTVVTFTIPATQCASTVVANIVVTDETGQISRLCRIEQYAEPISIQYNPLSLTFPYYGGPLSFSVSANCMYSIASGNGDWYTFTPTTGTSGETDFTVSAASINSGNTDWTGTINIVGPEGVAAVLTMTQLNQGQYSINYTADTSTIDYSGETRTITIDATDFINSSITVTILDAPDVTYTYQTSGLTRGIITLTIPQNPGGERNFKVVVSGRRAMSQNYSSAAIQYTQAALQLDFVTDTSNVRGSGEVRTITILNSNINPNRTGLNLPSDFPQQGSYTVSGNVITLTYPANPSSSATRTWTIGVVAQTNDGVSLSGSYHITQNANVTYSIPYTADTSNVDWSGETRIITIDASNLVASSITVGVAGATGVSATYDNGVITVVFPRNMSASQKNVTVTVFGETITGNYAEANIQYSQDTGVIYDIPYTADTSTVNQTGETRYIYIDCSQLITSSITVSSSGIPGTIVSYDSATCIATVVFQDASSSGYEILSDTITIEGETINGNYAYAVVYYEQAGVDISTIPLTFVIKTDGYIRWGQMNTVTTDAKTISYSKNGGEWIEITSSVVPSGCPKINVVAGDVLRFKGNNSTYGNSYGYAHFQYSTVVYDVYGNIMSMIYGDDFYGETALTAAALCEFFEGEGIQSAKSLLLPATSINYGSYNSMFQNCSLLTETPSLPATRAIGTYAHMFAYCRSLKRAPNLPSVMNIGGNTFAYMFQGCSGLTTIPSDYLPILAQGSNIGASCFEGMFQGCSSLRNAPDLPYTSLSNSCYRQMFSGCTSLTTAPALPATTLASYCYYGMFYGCTALTTGPSSIPASTLPDWSCQLMFNGCSNLNYIKCLATDISAERSTWHWVENVASAGTFVKDPNMTGWTIGRDGIPTNWVVEDYTILPLYYTADTSTVDSTGETRTITIDTSNLVPDSIGIDIAGFTGITYTYSNGTITVVFPNNTVFETRSATITVTAETTNPIFGEKVEIEYTQAARIPPPPPGLDDPLTFIIITSGNIGWTTNDRSYAKTIEYKKNNDDWISITSATWTPTIQVEAGDIVQFRGDNTSYCSFVSGAYKYNTFSGTTCGFNIGGNIMSLITSTGYSGLSAFTTDYVFRLLFNHCTGLTNAGNLVLPATALTNECYRQMFAGCTSLTSAPELPATTLATGCYSNMFQGCTSLTTAPELSATTLAVSCYDYMFAYCASLTTAPELPATTLADYCYEYMFRDCTSLATAPSILPATTLTRYCYRSMFYDCTSLTTAPELPATTLTFWCYFEMFRNCTNLNYIKCLASDISADFCTSSWVASVASSGTFVKAASMNDWTTDTSGIPTNWTVQDAT